MMYFCACYLLHIQDAASPLVVRLEIRPTGLFCLRLQNANSVLITIPAGGKIVFHFSPLQAPHPTLPLSSAMPVGCIKSKWTTLFALMNKLAVHPDFTTILNETPMRVRLQQSSSILHLLSMFYKPSALLILDSFQIFNTFF